MRPDDEDISKLLTRYSPSIDEEEKAGQRVYYKFLLARSEGFDASAHIDADGSPSGEWRFRPLILAAIMAVVSFILVFPIMSHLLRKGGEVAVTQPAGDSIRSGESVTANGAEGMMLALRDGSRVEMRSQSQVRIDDAAPGLRIHLSAGSIIVTAAKQGAGHLDVETKDATVSVVGTVFVVNAEQDGSRVGVIEGVVKVKQGATEKKLFPGQQLTTNPAMEFIPLDVQVSWSRTHWALLQLSPLPAPHLMTSSASALSQNTTAGPQNIQESQGTSSPAQSAAFEVAAIKLRAPWPGTVIALATRDHFFGISGTRVMEDYESVTDLIMDAYKVKAYQILGAPAWATQKGDHYAIDARAPGESSPSVDQVRLMFQTLLAERFQLMFHRETKDHPVYELVISKNGPKLKDIPLDPPPDAVSQGPKPGPRLLRGPMTLLVQLLSSMVDRPVIDRTGLMGTYEYSAGWARPALNMNLTRPPDQTDPGESIFTAVEEDLGLKLQPVQGPVEFLVIDSVRKPTEN